MRRGLEESLEHGATRLSRQIRYNQVKPAPREVPESQAAIELHVFNAGGFRVFPGKGDRKRVTVLEHDMCGRRGLGKGDPYHPNSAPYVKDSGKPCQIEMCCHALEEQSSPCIDVIAAEKPMGEVKDGFPALVFQRHGLVHVLGGEFRLGHCHSVSLSQREGRAKHGPRRPRSGPRAC